jgi:hypothetical protein
MEIRVKDYITYRGREMQVMNIVSKGNRAMLMCRPVLRANVGISFQCSTLCIEPEQAKKITDPEKIHSLTRADNIFMA